MEYSRGGNGGSGVPTSLKYDPQDLSKNTEKLSRRAFPKFVRLVRAWSKNFTGLYHLFITVTNLTTNMVGATVNIPIAYFSFKNF